MFEAIIATIVTLVVLAILVFVAVLFTKRKKSDSIGSGKHSVRSIDTIGLPSSLKSSGKQGGKSFSIKVGSPQTSVTNPMERLRGRFVAMGVLTAAIFGALGIRLWNIQVLMSEEYGKKAQQNTYTTVSTTAPRGYIYDAEGIPLVKNRTSLTILANVEVANDRSVVQRLSALLGIPHNIVRQRILDSTSGAQSQRVVASDVKLRDIAFISEHSEAFPGVTHQSRTVREYPWGALAAHVLGYTGAVDEDDLDAQKEGVLLEMGDTVGKSGIEAIYENLLAGDHGQRVVVADADGSVRQVVSETAPTKGNDVYLTIKAPVQQVADKVLAALVAPEGAIGSGVGMAASLICMDVTDGSIIALANYPTYTPESFIGGISTEIYNLLTTENSHYPLMNRAIAGSYPAASTFKAFTGLAGLEHGFADTEREWDCQGSWIGFGEEYKQMCWNRSGHGRLGFRSGVVVSCDTVFYEIAKNFYDAGITSAIAETALQDFIQRFGFGAHTGIDLDGETVGRIPTPAWKAEYFKDVPENTTWMPGDVSNMSIGQGYVLVTPIQMAVGYAAVATGKIPTPRLFKEVKNSEGDTVISAQPKEARTLEVNETHLQIMRDALKGVAEEDANVSREFANRGISSAAAKTGTAEVFGKKDFGWFACYAPYDNPKYVVTCVVEEGGGGSTAACPPSADVLKAVLDFDAGVLDKTMTYIPGFTGKTVEPVDTGNTARTD